MEAVEKLAAAATLKDKGNAAFKVLACSGRGLPGASGAAGGALGARGGDAPRALAALVAPRQLPKRYFSTVPACLQAGAYARAVKKWDAAIQAVE